MSAVELSNASSGSSKSKDKKSSDKDVQLGNGQRGVWLVKVPKYISDRWEKAPEKSELGRLKITRRQAGMKPEIAFTLDEAVAAARPSNGKSFTAVTKSVELHYTAVKSVLLLTH